MYEVNAKGDSTEMLIYQDIGDDYLGGISARQVVEDLKGIKSPTINVRINSGGGSVFDGNTIYNALRRHPSRVEVDIDGLAASIASVIAMAGDEVRMSDNSLMMIHNAWSIHAGDSSDFRKMADTLDKANDTVLSAYEKRTGNTREQLAKWMDDETWFNAAEALEHGFASSITEEVSIAAKVDWSRFKNAPEPKPLPANPVLQADNSRDTSAVRLLLTKCRG